MNYVTNYKFISTIKSCKVHYIKYHWPQCKQHIWVKGLCTNYVQNFPGIHSSCVPLFWDTFQLYASHFPSLIQPHSDTCSFNLLTLILNKKPLIFSCFLPFCTYVSCKHVCQVKYLHMFFILIYIRMFKPFYTLIKHSLYKYYMWSANT